MPPNASALQDATVVSKQNGIRNGYEAERLHCAAVHKWDEAVLANEYAAIENRAVSGHVEYGVIGVVEDSRIFQSCVKVKDYSAAGVFQTHTGDNHFVAFRVVSGVCRNCARVDDSARDIKRAWDKDATGIFNVARAFFSAKSLTVIVLLLMRVPPLLTVPNLVTVALAFLLVPSLSIMP
jgi:hypothetical protein